jgi:urease accessory protein
MNRNLTQRFGLVVLLAGIALLVGPRTALAHTGVSPAHDLLHGFEHPIAGLDHLLAMFAIGLWAAQRGGGAIWFIPLTFVLAMTFGMALGMSGISISLIEPGIAASVLILGLILAAGIRLPLLTSAAIVGLFAILHGHAHGAEIPAAASALTYAAGLLAATIILHLVGISCGLAAQRLNASHLVRYAGAAIATCGLFLCTA